MPSKLDWAKAELAVVRKIAMYEALAKAGRLSQDAADSLIAFERECLKRARDMQANQGELSISEAKRKG